tara:strand:+ start:2256 stop:2510 length:255 start_codon:yes stop_codon:yes gene_type:complete
MFGQCLLLGTGIGGISTGIYAAFTNDKYDHRDRKNEFISIFCIILIVSIIMLYIFQNSSENLVKLDVNPVISTGSMMAGGKPPF